MEYLQERLYQTAAVPLNVSEVPEQEGEQLRIIGTAANNQITVTETSTGIVIGNTGGWNKTVSGSVNSLYITGGAGNNTITLQASVKLDATIFGGGVNDTIIAGNGNNTIYGGSGTNVIQSRGGNDTLVTLGSKSDTIIAGTGFDSFWTDNKSAEKIQGVTPTEIADGCVHRVSSYYNASSIVASGPASHSTLSNGTVIAPTVKEPTVDAGVKYTPESSNPIFAPGGPSANDIFQGNADDCYFLSVLSSTAKVDPTRIEQSILNMNDGTVVVQLFKNGSPIYVREDESLPTLNGSSYYDGMGTDNSTWAPLMEKAFAYVRTKQDSYSSLDEGWMSEAYAAIGSPHSTSTYSVGSAAALMNVITSALDSGQSVTCAVTKAPTNSGLVADHAYTVAGVGYDSHGNPINVTLRNPWGCDANGAGNGYITISASEAFEAVGGVCSAYV